MNSFDRTSRAQGALLGLACGDALGRPVEFKTPEQIQREHGRLTEMVGDGSHGKPAGTTTDDTAQMLGIARSLDSQDGFDPVDVSRRFVEWHQTDPFDIGITTRKALAELEGDEESWRRVGREVYELEKNIPNSGAGNGSVMRCAPVALAYHDDLDSLHHASVASSWITHADPRCTIGCALLNQTIAGILNDAETPLQKAVDACRERAEVDEDLAELLDAAEHATEADESSLRYTGYVVDTLQASLYHAFTSGGFEEAVVDAVNGGGDTDTIGAVTGALAGALYGSDDIPGHWLDIVEGTGEVTELARQLSDESYDRYSGPDLMNM